MSPLTDAISRLGIPPTHFAFPALLQLTYYHLHENPELQFVDGDWIVSTLAYRFLKRYGGRLWPRRKSIRCHLVGSAPTYTASVLKVDLLETQLYQDVEQWIEQVLLSGGPKDWDGTSELDCLDTIIYGPSLSEGTVREDDPDGGRSEDADKLSAARHDSGQEVNDDLRNAKDEGIDNDDEGSSLGDCPSSAAEDTSEEE